MSPAWPHRARDSSLASRTTRRRCGALPARQAQEAREGRRAARSSRVRAFGFLDTSDPLALRRPPTSRTLGRRMILEIPLTLLTLWCLEKPARLLRDVRDLDVNFLPGHVRTRIP